MSAITYHNSLSNWLTNLKSDDIDGGLAADFDGSLSGLGVELGSSTYNMSEALLALPVFKQEQYDQGFQYLLTAATSPATKMNEETLTYLNQGQSYEVKLKRIGDLDSFGGKKLKSIVRVVFHERRLQYVEKEQLESWKFSRQGERILDIDLPLSYGLTDVKYCENRLNAAEFLWDPKHDTGIFVKVNCISTEFTPKKHGGEKGVPFRVQVESYLHDVEGSDRLLHCASCQVKVFKPKGADRKQKTDREKIDKKTEAEKLFFHTPCLYTDFKEEKYQPSYECTVMTEIPIAQVKVYLEQLKLQTEEAASPAQTVPSSLHKSKSLPVVQENNSPNFADLGVRNFEAVSTSWSQADSNSYNENKQTSNKWNISANATGQLLKQLTIGPASELADPDASAELLHLSADTSAEHVALWLQQNRFSNFVRVFQSFSGSDLLRLSRDDLIQICGLADGIRLNNALQAKTVRPKLTIFVCQASGGSKESKRKNSGVPPCGSPPSQPATPIHVRPIGVKGCGGPTSPITVVTSTNSAGFNTNFPQTLANSPPGGDNKAQITNFTKVIMGSPPRRKHSSQPETPITPTSPTKGPQISPTQGPETSPLTEGSDSGKNHIIRTYSSEGRSGVPGSSPPIAVPPSSKSKRQYREEDNETEDETLAVSYSKKQRTRNLHLSRKEVYHAVFLEQLTLSHLIEKLAALFSIQPQQIIQVGVQWPSGVLVLATNSVVQNFVDQTRYKIEAIQDDDEVASYRVYLQAVNE